MTDACQEIEFAIEVFVRGHCVGKSRTFPYQPSRVGPLWVMRDAERKNPGDYRKEDWIASAPIHKPWTRSCGSRRAGISISA